MDIEILAHKFYEYSLYIKGYSPETIKRYKKIIDFYCRFANVKNIEEITEKSLKDLFLHGRIQRNWRPNTFILYHLSLGVFFKWCIASAFLKENPIVNIELPKVEKRISSKLTRQEAMKLLEVVYNYPYDSKYLSDRNHAIFAIFIFAGLRKSELLHLRFADVDIENLSIFVHQGKGSKDRIVPMSFTLSQSLKRYIEGRKRLNKTCPEFFASSNRNMCLTRTGLKRIVEQIQKASGIKFTIRKLRHTFATLMLEGGCDIYSLSRMMGHSDIKTTTIYLSASAEHLRSQMMKHPLNT